MNPAKRHEIFSRLRDLDPHPTTELDYQGPFELLVAVILSAQATDKGVNLATRKLFPKANTPAAIYKLGIEGLERYIQSIGLYHSKAKHIIATCKILVEQYGGEVPRARSAGELAGRGPQDRERGVEYRLRRAHHRGRYAHLPRGEPD